MTGSVTLKEDIFVYKKISVSVSLKQGILGSKN